MLFKCCCYCSVTKLYPTLWDPHELQHTKFPCPSLSPTVCPNSCPLSQWCYPTISSSVASFSSCPQSFPASGSLPMSRLFALGGQSIGTSASASTLPMSIQGLFPLGLTGLISLQSKGLSRFFFSNSPNNLMKYLSHCTDEEAEAQRGSVACWKWPSLWEDTVAK